ncbi:hypothetical protein Tco_0979061 [Tanacetum coccineum]
MVVAVFVERGKKTGAWPRVVVRDRASYPVDESNFRFRRKSPLEKFSGGGSAVVAGIRRRWWPDNGGREREFYSCVPPSPDYIPGPEEPQSPPPLDFVSEPIYPEYMPQEDEILPAEEQPLPAATSPTADSPGYVPESDPEEEPEEDDVDPEEDLTDYPADRDNDDDDDEDEDKDEDEEDEDPLPHIPSPPLPISSPPPNSPTHIETPESCLPLRKRVRFASPTPSHEVGESSAAGAARQDRPAIAREDPYAIARGDLYGFVNMVDVAPGHPMSRELDYGITDT